MLSVVFVASSFRFTKGNLLFETVQSAPPPLSLLYTFIALRNSLFYLIGHRIPKAVVLLWLSITCFDVGVSMTFHLTCVHIILSPAFSKKSGGT